MFDLIREIYQTIRNNKLRTALTGLSVAWGIFMLIILLGMSRGVYNSFNNGFMSQASNSIQLWGGMTTVPYKGYKEGRAITMKLNDSKSVTDARNEHIKSAMPVISGSATTISTPRDYISASYEGIYPEYLKAEGYDIVAGRSINQADVCEGRKVIVLEQSKAEILFNSVDEAIGGYVTMNGLLFRVVGLYKAEWGQNAYIPITTARVLNGYKEDASSMLIEVKNMSSLEQGEQVEQNVREVLSKEHDFKADDHSALWIWNRFTQHMQMSNGLNILNIAIWIIGLFTMLSGIIGVSNIMFVSVKERTHEIGIRRAIGAKPRAILGQIILESVFITGLFGYIGILFGIIVTEVLNVVFSGSQFLSNPTVTLSIAIEVTLVLIVAGSLAGLFPALKALKVKPVEALRTE